jgi:hypothetical protein
MRRSEQLEPPFLLGPGVGQRAGERRHRETGWRSLGERNASGASRRICRSILPSRRAIAAKLVTGRAPAHPSSHQKTVQILLWVIASGENADLQRFASGTLPDVLHHLQLAQNLVSQLTGAAAPATN